MTRLTLYLVVNLLFCAAAVTGFATHDAPVHPGYVMLLFAICSTPLLEVRQINGPYSLLCLFSLDYFLMFGAQDFLVLLTGGVGEGMRIDGLFDTAELVILLGGILVQAAYRIACRAVSNGSPGAAPKDWPEATLVIGGLLMWVVCTRLNWYFSVHVITDATNETVKRGLGGLNGVEIGTIMIARMAQPLSILILAYAQCRYRRPYMAPVVLALVVFQLIFGFIIDFKTEALIGGVLVVLTNLLVTGRVPKAWVMLMAAVIAIGFPLLQANRVVRNEHAANATSVSENLAETFRQTLAAKDKVNSGRERAQTALERLTLKGSVEVIVRGTGVAVPFQGGYTLTPIVTAFIPRLLYPDKPVIPTGQIMNKTFNLSAAEDTYMSPSHLGELYWNFGLPGVLVGMTLIGFLLGFLGAKFNLAEAATITRVLVIVVTVRQVIIASEGEFATQYVVWMRSMLGIGLLHWALARVPRVRHRPGDVRADPAGGATTGPLYPNLLR